MKSVKLLLDLAREKVGTDAELARRLGTSHANVTNMRKGERAISPETVALLCDVLELPGDEAREYLALAIIENPKNASKAAMLRRALFACWAIGVCALSTLTEDALARGMAWNAGAKMPVTELRGYDRVTSVMHIGAVRHVKLALCSQPGPRAAAARLARVLRTGRG